MTVSTVVHQLGDYLDPSVGGVVIIEEGKDWYEVYQYDKGWETPPSTPVASGMNLPQLIFQSNTIYLAMLSVERLSCKLNVKE